MPLVSGVSNWESRAEKSAQMEPAVGVEPGGPRNCFVGLLPWTYAMQKIAMCRILQPPAD